MQSVISNRVKGYPQKALAEMHRARCIVPVKVAAILQQQPQLVSPAVQAFYYRDVQDMQAAAKLRHFPSEVGCCQNSCLHLEDEICKCLLEQLALTTQLSAVSREGACFGCSATARSAFVRKGNLHSVTASRLWNVNIIVHQHSL